jgi:uncharacterized membrane protein
MTTSKPINSAVSQDAHKPLSVAGKLEDDASSTAASTADALGAIKVAAVVLLGLFVWPPLAVLAFLIVVPALVVALVVGLLVAVLSSPYLLIHHFRGNHGGHMSLLAHRLRGAARALIDLAPHRIVADVRNSR